MGPKDETLVKALVHDANMMLLGGKADDLGLERDIADARESLSVAERILNGTATDEDRASVPDIVHPSVRSLYLDA